MIVIPTDVYDKDGNMVRIEFYTQDGEFLIQAEWDSRDEQTSKKREEFRKWAYKSMKNNYDYVVKT
jgi:hypothetical protein